MATNKELQQQVSALEKKITQIALRNSRLVDEISILKNNYTTLVNEVSARFEAVQKRFQKK
tara:strand:+ start:682 stop:864 length:183 start_codon:yes stop_codon:yes gene_type:complete